MAADAPDGIHLRELVGDDDWEQSVHVGASDTAEPLGGGRLVFERRRTATQRGFADSGRARWFGAFDRDRLVARLGIAGALVRAAGEWALEDPAVGQLVIVAEEGGPAIGLYERAGFAEVARHVGVSHAPADT